MTLHALASDPLAWRVVGLVALGAAGLIYQDIRAWIERRKR